MKAAADGAGGNQTIFLKLFDVYVKKLVIDNPLLLKKIGWQ